jgi:hypothetical protein
VKPIAIDLFCGLGGWSEGFLAEGYDVIGFDNERHRYPMVHRPETSLKLEGNNSGKGRKIWTERPIARLKDAIDDCEILDGWQEYPAQLVLQDVLTIHGSQFRNAAVIVASPPCQAYSYMAMPWKRGKAMAAAIRADATGVKLAELTALFDACFRIQREACEAAGHHIPLVVENVKGAQPWVGRAKANFGSFYLWGDVAMVGNRIVPPSPQFSSPSTQAYRAQKFNPDGTQHPQGSWFAIAGSKNRGAQKREGRNFHGPERGESSPSFNGGDHETRGVKQHGSGAAWFDRALDERHREATKGFVTGLGRGHDWRQDPSGRFNSKSSARKAASAQIAKIPFELASWIARCYKPEPREVAGTGSEVYTAVKLGRRGIGCELKPSYFDASVKNLRRIESEMDQDTLFSPHRMADEEGALLGWQDELKEEALKGRPPAAQQK